MDSQPICHRSSAMDDLRAQVRVLETVGAARLEMLEQKNREIAALQQQIDQVHHDAFHWLLSTASRPLPEFHFVHPVEPDLVTAVIPAYKASGFLERSVRSVWDQQLAGRRIEVMVCEDGSPDSTHELAVALQHRSPMPMQVLTHPQRVNRGVSATRNLGLRQARGAFVALLDADDAWLPNRLAVQFDYFDQHPALQCVCSHGYNRDPDGNPVKGWNDTPIAGDFSKAPPPNDATPPYTFDHMLRTDPIVNSTLLIRREALAAVGGYPDVMAHQVEDWLLLAKLSLLAPIHLIEQPLIDYTIHPGSYSTQYFVQGLAYGVKVEFLFHLVHWMLHQPQHRELGMQIFRRNYPRFLATHHHVALLLEEYYQHAQHPQTPGAEFEKFMAEVFKELLTLRTYYERKEKLIAPLRNIPGLKKVLRAVRRLGSHATRLRRSA